MSFRSLRLSYGFTQQEVADWINGSQSAVHRNEVGENHGETAERLEKFFYSQRLKDLFLVNGGLLAVLLFLVKTTSFAHLHWVDNLLVLFLLFVPLRLSPRLPFVRF